ncbi:hypothetical protein KJ975_12745, partial [Myxococcota bacterium]|nr:hypothetical protein [Myxococcota bacterium]
EWTLANQPSSLLAGFIRTDDIEKLLIYEEIESISISISISTWHFAPKLPGGYDVDPLVQKNEKSIALEIMLSPVDNFKG